MRVRPWTSSTSERRERYVARFRDAERMRTVSPHRYWMRLGILTLLGELLAYWVVPVHAVVVDHGVRVAWLCAALLVLSWWSPVIVAFVVAALLIALRLWMRARRPKSLSITAADAPVLFAEIASLRADLGLPRIHEVLVDDEFNASMTRFGIPGWTRNTLTLGLPLMMAVTPQEMRAVVAHEAAHLVGLRCGFSRWVSRVLSITRRQAADYDTDDALGAGILDRCFKWYMGSFDAFALPLMRAVELEADAMAVAATSPEVAASSLAAAVRDDVAGELYWRPLIARAHHEPRPAPYAGLARFHRSHTPAPGVLDHHLERALAVRAGALDTHPSMRDRLAAIGATPCRRFNVDPSAADAWLGGALDRLIAALDARWVEQNADFWREQCEQGRDDEDFLDAIRDVPRAGLDVYDLLRLAALTARRGDIAEALALYRELAGREPGDPDVRFELGRFLLDRDDPAGIAHLEHAASTFRLAFPASELIHAYWSRMGDEQASRGWQQRLDEERDRLREATVERTGVTAGDAFEPSELSSAKLDYLRQTLAADGGVHRAWVARKRIRVAPEHTVVVIAFTTRRWPGHAARVRARLDEEILWRGDLLLVPRAGRTRAAADRVAAAGDTLL
ncbi:MAG: M48 family metalloprotease [Ectothiorhodospiraceae bacterium]|nr:M48 family metalloprotease [Chromatiales bacterium]MCP5153611.1 M48 family metalloprotease [Ectothiorhodospiraceae bacterium]